MNYWNFSGHVQTTSSGNAYRRDAEREKEEIVIYENFDLNFKKFE